MRFFKITLTAAIAVGLIATSANALVSVFHTNDTAGAILELGDSFNVDVFAAHDGLGSSLIGIFASAAWDPSELLLTNATDAPFIIFFGADGFLGRFTNPRAFPGDPAGTIRTVQFGAPPSQQAGAGPDTLITSLTFQVIGGVDGIADIDVIFNGGDAFLAIDPFALIAPSEFSISGTSVRIIPEPSTALLIGLGLVGLAARKETRSHVQK